MYYTIYQTTNNVNGFIYIGMHQTDDLNDDYLGSGLRLNRAIKKYGRENFTKKILHIFETKIEMIEKEKELVTWDFVESFNTYNLCVGGHGGGIRKGATLSIETKQKISQGTKKAMQNQELRDHLSNRRKERVTKDSTREKISKRVSNTIWVNKNNTSKMIPRDEIDLYIKKGWNRGRGIKSKGTPKRVILYGVEFLSLKDAAKTLNKSDTWLRNQIKSQSINAYYSDT